MIPFEHWIKHLVTCPPGCDWDDCVCACHDHSAACWPGKPDPACVCQQDELPDDNYESINLDETTQA